ncbi:MAG: hypothetical protein RBT51_05980 [Ectothiorhodospiraceae bacterium]|jgi:hypothetical protein|nr:hypothetical protein [Ectothiorhodospiraceae bacterium]
MFKDALVRELAAVLVIKLALIWTLWFLFFRAPAAETNPEPSFGGHPVAHHIETRSAE